MSDQGATTPIDIVYDWRTLEFAFEGDKSVGALLEEAAARFGLQGGADGMALVDTHDRELERSLTLRQAGVEPGGMLVLRKAGDTTLQVQWSR